MASAIRAVFWDFGGVVTSSPFEAFRAYEHERGLPENFLRRVNSLNPSDNAWAKLERSDITPAEFDALFLSETEALGHPVRGRDVLPLLAGRIRPAMVAVLERVRADYRVACLTNNIAFGRAPALSPSERAQSELAAVMARFHFVLESSKAGVRKPDPRFYQLACAALEVTPNEVVYLDDLGINLKPAQAMGMRTIKVEDPTRAITELGEVLGLDLLRVAEAAERT